VGKYSSTFLWRRAHTRNNSRLSKPCLQLPWSTSAMEIWVTSEEHLDFGPDRQARRFFLLPSSSNWFVAPIARIFRTRFDTWRPWPANTRACEEEYIDWEEYQHNTTGVKLFEKPIEGRQKKQELVFNSLGYSLPMWRIEGVLPATISECVAVLNNSDFEKRKKIDKLCVARQFV
jgi:hypothetical protein